MSLRFNSIKDVPEHMLPGYVPPPAKPSKYRNQPVVVDGERFDSKLEARYYEQLKLRKAAGDVKWWIRQVPFRLDGGVVYRADFLVVERRIGEDFAEFDYIVVVDCKGKDTQASINKRKQVKARYGVEVKLWK